MQAIPIKVKNVKVYKCFNPDEPLTELIIEGATGTYAVGTLITNVFYNLDLNDDGDRVGPLNVHNKYYATGETLDGNKFTTPCMYCLNNSDQPKFGLTVSMLKENTDNALIGGLPSSVDPSEYIRLEKLTNITVTQSWTPPEIGETVLIENGTGYSIGTRIGTPHLMGVEVDSGDRVSPLQAGSKNITITATREHGLPFFQNHLTTISAGEPAIFLRLFER